MKSIEYFFELIQQSNVSLLGYRFKQERLKDEIISKLPHLVVPEIDSSFSFKSFLRDKWFHEATNSYLKKQAIPIKSIIAETNNKTNRII